MTTTKRKVRRLFAGCYEVTDAGEVFTVTCDRNDDNRWKWYCRLGAFPGGAAFEVCDTLREAVEWCRRAE